MSGGELGGLLGGIVGGALGIAGGVIGTWFSLRNTKTVEERRFMVRMSAAVWAGGLLLAVFLVLWLTGVLPQAAFLAVWIASLIALGPVITLSNKRLARLREEGTPRDPAS